jgi:hypothetical protein
MSLPLTRRIARAALLVGAAAAPLVGIGASAASAAELPVGELGGLTSLDKTADVVHSADLTHTVEGVAKGAKTVTSLQKALPDPGRTLTGAAKTTAPVARKTATDAAGAVKGAAKGVGGTTKGAEGAGPLKGLPISQLPVGQLPIANAGLPIGG